MVFSSRRGRDGRAGETRLAWSLPGLSGPQTLEVRSEAFGDGGAIPVEYAGKRAGGRNLSPPLAWTAPPAETAEQLLVMQDVDVPLGAPFVHCVALIEARVSALPAGGLAAAGPAPGVRVLRSGMGRGYLGPEPIKGHGPHRYVFQVFALATPAIAAGDGDAGDGAAGRARPRALLAAVAGPVLARGRLTGVYSR